MGYFVKNPSTHFPVYASRTMLSWVTMTCGAGALG